MKKFKIFLFIALVLVVTLFATLFALHFFRTEQSGVVDLSDLPEEEAKDLLDFLYLKKRVSHYGATLVGITTEDATTSLISATSTAR